MNPRQYILLLTEAAEQAMIEEVMAAPKPGLVDRFNNGSHRDMTLTTFLASARALKPHFQRMLQISLEHGSDLVLPRLRAPGMEAEQAMFNATGGVNTHKGLIFSLGLVSACLARLALMLGRAPVRDDMPALIALIQFNTRGLTQELDEGTDQSHGHAVYLSHGLKGIRQEAQAGYPAVFQTGLPSLQRWQRAYSNPDLPLVMTLLELILVTEDTNLVRRGGLAGLSFMRKEARSILVQARELEEASLLGALRRFDEAAIQKGLSPGGAADGLALSLFLANTLDIGGAF